MESIKNISQTDRELLRGLAQQILEIAHSEENNNKRELWRAHNDLERVRPMILCDPENGWSEIITSLACTNETARRYEKRLRKTLFWGEKMGDDRVLEPWFEMDVVSTDTGWGLSETLVQTGKKGAFSWIAPLSEYADMKKMHFPHITVDDEATRLQDELAHALLGDILPIRRKNYWWWTLGVTYPLAMLRGLEQMMYDLYDNPEELHSLLRFLMDGTMQKLDMLEEKSLLSLNSQSDFIGSHSHGYTNTLPQPDFCSRVRCMDMWGFAESQETVSLSAEMFEEFILPYQIPLLERFGLNYYGCCEALDKRFHLVKKIPRLRKVSVSAWADKAAMAELLEDKYVYCYKQNPSFLASKTPQWDVIRQDVRETLKVAKGCHIEFISKDLNTIGEDPRHVKKWCDIVREEIENS